MNNVFHGKNANGKIISLEDVRHPEVDSRALQEIIDILKHPFQSSCSYCNGLGFVRGGENCMTCKGTGKIIEKKFN